MKMTRKRNKGITLVALVVTVIILLILAGISIAGLTGNGLFEKTKLAKEKQKNAEIQENEKLGDYENKIGEYVDGNRGETVTINKEEYEKLKEKGKGELLASFTSANEIKEIPNIKNYNQFMIFLEFGTTYFNSSSFPIIAYSNSMAYEVSHNAGTAREFDMMFVDETHAKCTYLINASKGYLYGIK